MIVKGCASSATAKDQNHLFNPPKSAEPLTIISLPPRTASRRLMLWCGVLHHTLTGWFDAQTFANSRLLWTAHSDTNEAALRANADISFATKSGHFSLLRTQAEIRGRSLGPAGQRKTICSASDAW